MVVLYGGGVEGWYSGRVVQYAKIFLVCMCA